MEQLPQMNARINELKREIYVLLIDELYLDYSKAETIVEENLLIIGGNKNIESINKINNKFRQIKELQSQSGIRGESME